MLVDILHRGKTTDQTVGPRESALTKELVYGTLRHYYSLDQALQVRLEKSLRSKDFDLRCLMSVGAYQLAYLRIPSHAAINETVNACRALRKPWASGLVNAVLRGFERELDDYRNACQNDRSHELPDWIVKRLRAQWEDLADPIMTGLLERAPMWLRVNTLRSSVVSYQDTLDQAGIRWRDGLEAGQLVLEAPVRVTDLPGYAEGRVSVQDAGAQLATTLLSACAADVNPGRASGEPGARVLDACAAPGGKLFHLVERLPSLQVTALEVNAQRCAHLMTEASRLGHNQVEIFQADALDLDWFDGNPFQLVLVDAPCSGVGTLRRHPDIKHLRREEDLAAYQHLQSGLLANLWRTLAPGGTLAYCTCSLFREENDDVVGQFLTTHKTAVSKPIHLPQGQATRFGWQLYPLPASHTDGRSVDGFYYALIRKPTP